jgi:chlorobactene glucosyltransferase
MMEILVVFLLGVLVIIAVTTVVNTLTFPRLERATRPVGNPSSQNLPHVSILIPARNEVDVIGESVAAHLAQEGAHLEVLVLDDRSSDGTGQCALQAGVGDERLRVLRGEALPPGWIGKNWACHQLARQAQGEILVFTDADVRWRSGALRALLRLMDAQRAAMLTVWPTQRTYTWSERLVVPLMMFAILGYLPEIAVRRLPLVAFAAANGQCLAFRREVYERIGGHQRVRAAIVEDVSLARLAKRAGYRLVMALGDRQVETRMYQNWAEVRNGFAKNILAGHAGRPLLLLVSSVFHWALFILPWAWLLAGWPFSLPGWPWVPLAMIALGLGARALSAATSGQRVIDALFMPFSVLSMTVIAALSLWWHYRHGGPQWKGRWIHPGGPAQAAEAESLDG